MKKLFLILLVGAIFNCGAFAQDVMQTMVDNSFATQQTYLTSHINGLVMKDITGKNAATAREDRLTYNPHPRIKAEVIDAMLKRMKLTQGTATFKKTDFDKIFTSLTSKYSFSYDDAGDIVTAYQVLNWMIANKVKVEPAATAVNVTRTKIGAGLMQNKNINHNVYERAKLGEEMKILFVVLHAGWQNALKNGSLDAYSDGIAKQYQQQYGIDLRKLKLDNQGMHL